MDLESPIFDAISLEITLCPALLSKTVFLDMMLLAVTYD